MLLTSVLSGFAIAQTGATGARIGSAVDLARRLFLHIIGMVVQVAPIGAFGALAFTVGAYGVGALVFRTFYASAFFSSYSARSRGLLAFPSCALQSTSGTSC